VTGVKEIVFRLEAVGGKLMLHGEHIRYSIPSGDAEARGLLGELRGRKGEVADFLRVRAEIPTMPRGVRLIRFEPKRGPVALDVCSIVTDVDLFIRRELEELRARLHSPVQGSRRMGSFHDLGPAPPSRSRVGSRTNVGCNER